VAGERVDLGRLVSGAVFGGWVVVVVEVEVRGSVDVPVDKG
jgi:hypothetical protein